MPRRPAALDGVLLGPLLVAGHTVVVRPTRLSDFRRWREVRLRDQQFIEPYWTSSPLDWAHRHTEAQWVREQLNQRLARRKGLMLPLAIEVDGEFAGECNLYWDDPGSGTAELGIWLDSQRARAGVGVVAGALVADFAFADLGLHRITAPICVDNHAAAVSAERGGMVREATMIRCLDVGGRHKDHALWAVTTDRTPPGGLAAATLQLLGYTEHEIADLPRTQAGARARLHRLRRDLPGLGRAALAAARYSIGAPRRLLRDLEHREVPAQLGPLVVPRTAPLGPDEAPVRHELRLVTVSGWSATKHMAAYVDRWRHHSLSFDLQLDGRRAGRLEFLRLDRYHRTAELRAQIDWAAADIDAAARAFQLLSDFAFADLKLVRLCATVDPRNDRSTELMKRAGMNREGTLTAAGTDDCGKFVDLDLWAQTDDRNLVP